MKAPWFFSGPVGGTFTALATIGPLGTRLPAPGTWGSAAGLLLYSAGLVPFNNPQRWTVFLGVMLALILLAIISSAIAEKFLQKKDPGCVIIDEVVAMPLVFIGLENTMRHAQQPWVWLLLGFGLFRFFDILKPLGIKQLQKLPGGLGIVADDLAAAAAAGLVLHTLHFGITFLR